MDSTTPTNEVTPRNTIQNSPKPSQVSTTLSFSLLNDGIARWPREGAELREIREHFPTMSHISFVYPFLVMTVTDLPPKPWPTILADLPLWIKTLEESSPSQVGKFARAHQRFTVKGEILESKNPKEDTIREIYDLLCGLGAGVDSIRWDGVILRGFGVLEPAEGWENRLPRMINGFSICYFWEEGATANDLTGNHPRRLDSKVTRDVNSFNKVFMNASLHGKLAGCHIETEWLFINPAGNNVQQEKIACIISHFSYWGNGNVDISPNGDTTEYVWNERFENLGQFMFQEKSGQRRIKIRGV